MSKISIRLAVATVLIVPFTASAQTASLQIERVTQAPVLKPLAMSTPSRVAISGGVTKDYATQWPGVYFDTKFQGTALFFTVGPAHEILHLVVDNQAPLVLADPVPGLYRVAGLRDSPHTASLFIATESASAANHFSGFAIMPEGKELTLARRSRQIEFIGDSYTVGYGNISPQRDCSHTGVYPATDDTQAFGPLIARHFNADYQINAISGRGVVRNYDGIGGDPVPVAYPFVLLDKKLLYRDPRWKPQWIVISLGTNDFSTGLNPSEKWKTREELHADYETTYVQFLQRLRANDPGAYLIVWATNRAKGEIASEGQRVVDRMKAAGEEKIAFLSFDQLAFTGCDSHPSVADDKAISAKMVEFIEAHPGLWKDR